MNNILLSTLVFLPLIGSGLVLILPDEFKGSFKWITVIICVLNLLSTLSLFGSFDRHVSDFQFVEHYEWIRLNLGNLGTLSIDYILGVDGLNIAMVLLSAIVLLIGAVSSFSIEDREKGYYMLYLLLTSSIFGCFLALDFFLFFMFFEFMLLPMYFLIGIWGGDNREYASIKFFIYTLLGSIFILIVLIALGISSNDNFFSKKFGGELFTHSISDY